MEQGGGGGHVTTGGQVGGGGHVTTGDGSGWNSFVRGHLKISHNNYTNNIFIHTIYTANGIYSLLQCTYTSSINSTSCVPVVNHLSICKNWTLAGGPTEKIKDHLESSSKCILKSVTSL